MSQKSVYRIENLKFSYPQSTEAALDNVNLEVYEGDFLVLCGPSGCGKSTLLRQLKTVLAPHGTRSGRVIFEQEDIENVSQEVQAQKIGFVQQSPENQIVTDKVWHELAFGLESLGCDTPAIRRRVAEMASFFGIQGWFYKNVSELSGGQKQLLNLASVMTMSPNVLVLDEPTSQLDPIAASDFLASLGKINRELGVTVILTEHRLEEAFQLSTRVAVMDKGRIVSVGSPKQVGEELKDSGHSMFLAMPAAMRIWAGVKNDAECPITVREGRSWLTEFSNSHTLCGAPPEKKYPHSKDTAIRSDALWFRYEKDAPDVIRGLSIEVKKGEFLALLGGNGAGKTTALKLLSGLLIPYRGEIEVKGKIGVLPQDPQTLFVKKTVREDLFEILRDKKMSDDEKEKRVAYVVAVCRIEELIDRHPYDLSGGEQQRAALAKVLLLDPDILFMDEPTKGLDAEFKHCFAEILKTLLSQQKTVLMVSHDVEFCAEYAHRCAMFFDGSIVNSAPTREFFTGNSFYTTSANRMARSLIPEAVTASDVIFACGGVLPEEEGLPDNIPPLPEPREESSAWKPEKLPLWRKMTAAVSGGIALIIFIRALGVADLSEFIKNGGISTIAANQLWQYAVFVLSLFIMSAAIGRRSKPIERVQTPRDKRTLAKRTVVASLLILLAIPFTLFVGVYYLQDRKYYFIALMIMLECMIPFFLVFEGRKPQARELVIIAVLCAIGVAGRTAFFMLPNFKPVMAITIISAVAFGGESGFLVGAMTMLVSNVVFSQGPWTPWQMFAMGLIGLVAGILFRKGWLRRSRESLCVFGALAAVLIYGGIMNPASALMRSGDVNFKILLAYYITGFPVDCVHAAATALFLWFGGEPMLEKLDRIKVKYGLVE